MTITGVQNERPRDAREGSASRGIPQEQFSTLLKAVDGSPRPRAETAQLFASGAQALISLAPPQIAPALERNLDCIKAYLTTRPHSLTTQWTPFFREYIESVVTALSATPQDITAVRRAALPFAHHGAQLSILGAHVFQAFSAFEYWRSHPTPDNLKIIDSHLQKALELWIQDKPPTQKLSSALNTQHLLESARALVSSAASSFFSAEAITQPLRGLFHLMRIEHQWLRWSLPHNLSHHQIPKNLEHVHYRFDDDASQADKAHEQLNAHLHLSLNNLTCLQNEITTTRNRWAKALALLMPHRPAPFIVHFRDSLPPEEILREVQIIQHLWQPREKAGPPSPAPDSREWIRARFTDAGASLFAVMHHDRTLQTFCIALFDETRLPPGTQKVISSAIGNDKLQDLRRAKANDTNREMEEIIFHELGGTDYRDRGQSPNPTRILLAAVDEFGELDADGSRPVHSFSICQIAPVKNPSIVALYRLGWRNSGHTVENEHDEKYIILRR